MENSQFLISWIISMLYKFFIKNNCKYVKHVNIKRQETKLSKLVTKQYTTLPKSLVKVHLDIIFIIHVTQLYSIKIGDSFWIFKIMRIHNFNV